MQTVPQTSQNGGPQNGTNFNHSHVMLGWGHGVVKPHQKVRVQQFREEGYFSTLEGPEMAWMVLTAVAPRRKGIPNHKKWFAQKVKIQ